MSEFQAWARVPRALGALQTVPCTPLVDIPGLAFLSPNAEEELAKNLRPDVVSEGL